MILVARATFAVRLLAVTLLASSCAPILRRDLPPGPPGPPLRFDVFLDDSVYAPGQPIIAILVLRNLRHSPFRDLGELDPYQHVALRLTCEDDGVDVRNDGYRDFAYPGEGMLLEGNGVAVEAIRVDDRFLEYPPGSDSAVAALDPLIPFEAGARLGPGRYRLEAFFSARRGGARPRRLTPYLLTAPPVAFRVAARAPNSRDDSLAALFRLRWQERYFNAIGAPPGESRVAHAREWLQRFAGTKHFLRILRWSSIRTRPDLADSALAWQNAAGVRGVVWAATAGHVKESLGRWDREAPRSVKRWMAVAPDSLGTLLLSSWKRERGRRLNASNPKIRTWDE